VCGWRREQQPQKANPVDPLRHPSVDCHHEVKRRHGEGEGQAQQQDLDEQLQAEG